VRTPKHVLQVFANVARYGPTQHNAAARRELERWNDPILATSGAVDGRRILLGDAAEPPGRLAACDLLVLQDHNTAEARRAMGTLRTPAHLPLSGADEPGVAPFGVFGLRERAGDGLELYLRYTANAGWIGRPSRGDYKLADLREGRPVLVRLNGKYDHGLSSGRERTYLIADFVLEYLGRFDEFEVRPGLNVAKHPPLAAARGVDLREILY
jgi:hypothetical protein